MKRFCFILLVITSLFLFFRLQKLDHLLGYYSDQGIHLLDAKAMVDSRLPRLVGPMVTSKSYLGRHFFTGANYYYLLALFGLLTNWDPLFITISFTLLELFSLIIFTFWLRSKTNSNTAIITFLFLSLSPYLIIHSRFFWNPHLLLPLSIFTLIFLVKYFHSRQPKYLFFAAFFWGSAVACHYSAALWALFFFILFLKSRCLSRLLPWFTAIFGFVLGNLPFLIFEFRHSFYNLKTIFFIYTHLSSSQEFVLYYFTYSLLIFFLFGLAFALRHHFFLLSLILLFLTFIQSRLFQTYHPFDVVSGWNYQDQLKVTDLILASGCPKNYNLATTIQGDTRGQDIRFLLTRRNCPPLDTASYSTALKLFVVAPANRPPTTDSVWEIVSFGQSKIVQKTTVNSQVVLYELAKL